MRDKRDGASYHGGLLEVAHALGGAVLAALREAVAVQFRQAAAREAGAQVQRVHVARHQVRQLWHERQRQQHTRDEQRQEKQRALPARCSARSAWCVSVGRARSKGHDALGSGLPCFCSVQMLPRRAAGASQRHGTAVIRGQNAPVGTSEVGYARRGGDARAGVHHDALRSATQRVGLSACSGSRGGARTRLGVADELHQRRHLGARVGVACARGAAEALPRERGARSRKGEQRARSSTHLRPAAPGRPGGRPRRRAPTGAPHSPASQPWRTHAGGHRGRDASLACASDGRC